MCNCAFFCAKILVFGPFDTKYLVGSCVKVVASFFSVDLCLRKMAPGSSAPTTVLFQGVKYITERGKKRLFSHSRAPIIFQMAPRLEYTLYSSSTRTFARCESRNFMLHLIHWSKMILRVSANFTTARAHFDIFNVRLQWAYKVYHVDIRNVWGEI